MSDIFYMEIQVECPRCGENNYVEFEFNGNGKKFPDNYVEDKKAEKVECTECQKMFFAKPTLEIIVDTAAL